MANAGLFFGWKDVKAGRAKQANELFGMSMEFYGKCVAEGRIEGFEPVLLHRHGGDMNGFILIRGSEEQMDKLRRSEDFEAIVTKGLHCVDGMGVVDCYLGEKVGDLMQRWAAEIID